MQKKHKRSLMQKKTTDGVQRGIRRNRNQQKVIHKLGCIFYRQEKVYLGKIVARIEINK